MVEIIKELLVGALIGLFVAVACIGTSKMVITRFEDEIRETKKDTSEILRILKRRSLDVD